MPSLHQLRQRNEPVHRSGSRSVYNEIRRAALAGEPTFEAVILREAPVEGIVRAEGYLDLDMLVERGCTFGLTPDELEGAVEMPSGMSVSPLFGRLVRALTRIGRGVANAVRRTAAVFRLKRDFSLALRVVNTDPHFFDGSIPAGTSAYDVNILRSGWGAHFGRMVVPHGATVVVRTNMGITMENLDRNGKVSMRVPRDHKFSVLLRLRNDAAIITGLSVWEKRVLLHHGDGDADNRKQSVHLARDVRDGNLHTFALFTEARDFAVEQLNFHPRNAIVVDGPLNGASATPCWGFFGFGTTAFGHGRGWSLAVGVASVIADSDMNIRGDDGRSRGIVAHEYGHFLMCDMFRRESRRDFGRAYGEVIQDTIQNPSPHIGNEARLLAEGWADFYAAQVVGATNYFTTPGQRLTNANMNYCNADIFDRTRPCTEDNIGGPTGAFPGASSVGRDAPTTALGTVTTLMVDAFDGPGISTDALNASVRWRFSSSGVPSIATPVRGSAFDDERAALAGTDLITVVRTWSVTSDRLRFAPFYNSLASVLTERFDRTTACQVFALHEPSGDCVARAPALSTLRRKHLGAPFGLRVTTAINSAHTAPLVNASWQLVDPAATHTYVDLKEGTVEVDGALLPFAQLGTWTSTELIPFNALLAVRIAGSTGAVPESEFLTGTVRTVAEPVRVVAAEPLLHSVRVTWTPTAATSYFIRVNDGTLIPFTTTDVIVYDLTPWVTYKFEVLSVNAAGVVSEIPSPAVFAVPGTIE